MAHFVGGVGGIVHVSLFGSLKLTHIKHTPAGVEGLLTHVKHPTFTSPVQKSYDVFFVSEKTLKSRSIMKYTGSFMFKSPNLYIVGVIFILVSFK